MIQIPKKAFETKAEDGSYVLPSVGDKVPLDGFTGEVKSEDGDNLVVDLQEYNGEPVTYLDDPAEEKSENPDDAQQNSLIEQMSKGTEE